MMRIKYVVFVLTLVGYMSGFVANEREKVNTVSLFTDLVDIIGKNKSCNSQNFKNSSEEDSLLSKQGVVISTYKFVRVDVLNSITGRCDAIDLYSYSFRQYDWTCFATENSETSRGANWFLINCFDREILTIRCFDSKEVKIILENLCENEVLNGTSACRDFSYGQGQAVCSENFQLHKPFQVSTEKPESSTSTKDVVAYLCIAFILLTFFITMIIPAEKCKPTYKYDREQERRIPFEIYDMYGVTYQPSAKKKLMRKSINLEKIPSVSSHLGNVAVVANSPIDWGGIKTKFNFNNQPLLNPIVNGFTGKCEANSLNVDRRQSNESNDAFDYTLFVNKTEREHKTTSNLRRNSDPIKNHDQIRSDEKGYNLKQIMDSNFKRYANNTENTTVSQWESCKDGRNDKSSLYNISDLGNIIRDHNLNTNGSYSHGIDQRVVGSITDNIHRTYMEHEGKHIDYGKTSDSDSCCFLNADIDQYECIEKYNDNEHDTETCECICSCNVSYSSTTPEEENGIVKLDTISECTIYGDDDEHCPVEDTCQCFPESEKNIVEVEQEDQRPRISITIKLPKQFGMGDASPIITQSVQEYSPRKTKRSHSSDDTSIRGQSMLPVNLPRKHSIC